MVFSLLNSIKTKARNRFQLSLLEAIIKVRAELLTSNECCKESVFSTKFLNRFKVTLSWFAVSLIQICFQKAKQVVSESLNNEEQPKNKEILNSFHKNIKKKPQRLKGFA